MVKFQVVTYRLNVIASKTPFFIELEHTILKFIWKQIIIYIAKTTLGKNNSGGIIISDLSHTTEP